MRINCIITDTENIILVIVTVLKEVVTVIFLNEDIRERIILIILLFVCKKESLIPSLFRKKQVVSLPAKILRNINITLQIIY